MATKFYNFIFLFNFDYSYVLFFFFLFANVVCMCVGTTKLINTCVIEQCSGLLMVSLNVVVCCIMKRHYVRRKLPHENIYGNCLHFMVLQILNFLVFVTFIYFSLTIWTLCRMYSIYEKMQLLMWPLLLFLLVWELLFILSMMVLSMLFLELLLLAQSYG